MRASGRDDNAKIAPPRIMSLEESLEYIEDDELLTFEKEDIRRRSNVHEQAERQADGGSDDSHLWG